MNAARFFLLMCLASPALADDTIVFRCTDADDNVSMQSTPCPKGSHQVMQRMSAGPSRAETSVSTQATPVSPAPAPSAPSAPATPAPAAGTPLIPGTQIPMERTISEAYQVERGNAILDSANLPRPGDAPQEADSTKPPPPAIFQCQRADGGRYLNELEPAPAHCELLSVTGLGGVTPVNAASCEVVRDDCQEIAEADRCGAWQQRFRNARGQERFASADKQPAAVAERERLEAVLAASNCPVPQ
ncbi:hypothetical protein [Stenotrophomonas sp.]|uniref:hypothetical protein n=1 Tax=Stenotrophomonas sp. TaxID=69392 RepID=UPI002899AB2D|nr:hypothetical protein [Stenotrophomonas sp.]